MSVSLLMTATLQRLDDLRALAAILAQDGFDGEILVGVYRGHERAAALAQAFDQLGVAHRIFLQRPGCLHAESLSELARAARYPYVLWAPDDDFIYWPGVRACVARLEADPELACAQGAMYRIGEIGPRGAQPAYVQFHDILQDDVVDRLYSLFTDYQHLFFSVHRKESAEAYFPLLIHIEDQFDLMQYFWSSLILERGKCALVDEIMWVREEDLNSRSHQLALERDKMHPPYNILYPDFSARFYAFQQSVLERAAALRPLTRQDLGRLQDGFVGLISWMVAKKRVAQSAQVLQRNTGRAADLARSPERQAFFSKVVAQLLRRAERRRAAR